MKVHLLKGCMHGNPGDTVEVPDEEAKEMCRKREIWDGEKLVEYCVAVAEADFAAAKADFSIDDMTAAEMTAMGIKNVVASDPDPLVDSAPAVEVAEAQKPKIRR